MTSGKAEVKVEVEYETRWRTEPYSATGKADGTTEPQNDPFGCAKTPFSFPLLFYFSNALNHSWRFEGEG